ncbi:hypothetical protein [Microvirga aerophila]|uniref:General stress protein 17M-like domain-containing protein n=1 Tax=Microvirga aerophila TaxID=670291 RepID=A0A512BU21_9HYPH|nr:hypothetical protein [Microvirga aerophila]GEO15440.1 hypothetical protein MAE02_31360 [Microvirga aerophila]
MPRIVTALFQDQAKAQQALQALMGTGVAQSHVTAIGFTEGREVSSISGFRTLSAQDDSRAGLYDLNLPASDLRLFEQGLHRGCSLIAARVDQQNFEEAIRVLEMFDPVDLDRDSREWAQSNGSDQAGGDVGAPLAAGITGGSTAGGTNTSALPGMGQMTEAADDLGTADLRTDETAQPGMGAGTTTGTAGRRDDARADREGVNELALESNPPGAQSGFLQRHMNRGGRVWAYGSD